MLPSINGLKKRLDELQAIELQLEEYEQLYADANELTIANGPIVTFDAIEVTLTGVTQVRAVVSGLLRSIELQEALLSGQLVGIERRPRAKPEPDSNGLIGDSSDAVEP
jgi:hypothetical protein